MKRKEMKYRFIMERLDKILKLISEIQAPINSSIAPHKDTPEEWLDTILVDKLGNAGKDIGDDVRWNYVVTCFEYLEELKSALEEVSAGAKNQSDENINVLPPHSLSVKQEQHVSSLVQMIIALGILPSLLPGVGLPIEKRSKFYELVAPKKSNELKSVENLHETVVKLHQRIVTCTEKLLDLIDAPNLNQIILGKHLGDILAALIQLGHGPLKKPSEEEENNKNGDENAKFVMTKEKYDQLKTQQDFFKEELMKIVDRVYQSLIVKYLLVLQSCGASEAVKPTPKSINNNKKPTPKWVQGACGSLLTHCLTQSDKGVMNVIQGILDLGDDDNVQRYLIIAQVISNPPSTGKYSELETYFELVSPQILSILDQEDTSESKMYHMIACHCIRSLTERSLILSRRYLLDSFLLEPLMRLTKDHSEEKEILITEEELSLCIRRLHLCFVIVNDPSMIFVSHLKPIIMVLLELHVRINFGVSHLKDPVEQILQRFLRYSAKSMSLATIKTFVLGNYSEATELRYKFEPMLEQFAFVPGEGGGIKAIGKSFKKAEEQSFYVADDEKAIILVDLLQVDKNLEVEVFLSLLCDLTSLIKEEHEMNASLDLSKAKSSHEEELLQLELDLDKTMNGLRRRLMIIRMIGLMGEDDSLQENLMKNSERLISFLSMTLQRCASLCQYRQTNKEEDFEAGITEKQSLQTALGLITTVVTASNVQVEQWQMLANCLGDLTILSELHESDEIKLNAKKLKNLIEINAQIIQHHMDMKDKANDIIKKTEEAHVKMNELKLLGEKAREEKIVDNYEEAIEHLKDKEIPIKGHGLIALTNLVDKKDEKTMENIDTVFEIFNSNLNDPDTYIYLQAIKGLANCSFHKPELVIDKLGHEFGHLDDTKYPGEKGIEVRTKIGEALVQVTKILGEMTPAHKNKLLNPFLAQLSHPDPLIRSSSLSNLGEVCKNLKFSLGEIIHEIFGALHEIIQFDKAVEVRRAGVYVVKLLLEGLGDDALVVLQVKLRDIWRTLIAQRNSETDEIMQVHIQEALDQVNQIVKKLFQPNNELKKTIYVLDQPPDPFI